MDVVNIDEKSPYKGKCVLAIGMFDGLHKGHADVVKETKKLAKKCAAIPCVLTFAPHPSQIIQMGRPPAKMIFPPKQRAREFEKAGIKKVFEIKFTKDFAKLTPLQFASLLKEKFPRLKGVVTGFNFVFGFKAAGNTHTLAKLSEEFGWEFRAVKGKYLDDGRRISSSLMRTAVDKANFGLYEKIKGRVYSFCGKARRGKRMGAKLNFPTINIPWNPDCKPPFGSYAVEIKRLKTNKKYRGVASYGTSPTLGETEPLVEVNLFKDVDFGAPETFEVRMLKFLRNQKKFKSLSALVNEIARDKIKAQSYFDSLKSPQ